VRARKERALVGLNVDEAWALVQLAEASVRNDDELSPIEKKALEKIRRAHAKLYARTK
jgi:hypothetical protein